MKTSKELVPQAAMNEAEARAYIGLLSLRNYWPDDEVWPKTPDKLLPHGKVRWYRQEIARLDDFIPYLIPEARAEAEAKRRAYGIELAELVRWRQAVA